MKALKYGACVFSLLLVFVAVPGCFLPPEITGGLKVANNQLSQLTADEIKALNNLVNNAIKQQNPNAQTTTLTDQQAAALANFFKANNINSESDLTKLGQQIDQGQTPQGLDQLAAAFGNVDPNSINSQTLQQIFGSLKA